MDLADFTKLVASFVQDDDSRLDATAIDTAITLATDRYSRDQPKVVIEDVTLDVIQILNLPVVWVVDFSEIRSIESPIELTPPNLIIPENYFIQRKPGNVEAIKFQSDFINVGSTLRITFTSAHIAPDSFQAEDTELVGCLAAASLCDQLASFYGHDSASTIQSDSVDHQNKGRDFAFRAKSLRARYENKFTPETSTTSAAAIVELPKRNAGGGRRMFH